jgi:hypothetical protein
MTNEFCKCEEPKYMPSAMSDRIYSCGICWKPIKWDQCIDKIKMEVILDEAYSLLWKR